jgi:hypothetical protein
MNCPKCKNPIADDSLECEWCGAPIIINNIEKIKINVSSINFWGDSLTLHIELLEGKLSVKEKYMIEMFNVKYVCELKEIFYSTGSIFSKNTYYNDCSKNDSVNCLNININNYDGGWDCLCVLDSLVKNIKNFSFSINQI